MARNICPLDPNGEECGPLCAWAIGNKCAVVVIAESFQEIECSIGNIEALTGFANMAAEEALHDPDT